MYSYNSFIIVIIIMVVTFFTTSAQPSPKPSEYNALVNRCFSTYKECALGQALGQTQPCSTCEEACGAQEILSENSRFATVCTLIRDYCKDRLTSSEGDQCTETNCIGYHNQCLEKGLDDPSCGYCASSCLSCPKQYGDCRPNSVTIPSPRPGSVSYTHLTLPTILLV